MSVAVAPMMRITNRYMRHMMRLISKRTTLYTEMVSATKLLRHQTNPANIHKILGGSPVSQAPNQARGTIPDQSGPVVLQLGGFDPAVLGSACQIAAKYCVPNATSHVPNSLNTTDDADAAPPPYFTEVNLNCGCPSSSVSDHGAFGAALMSDSELVARICRSMQRPFTPAVPTIKANDGGVGNEDTYADNAVSSPHKSVSDSRSMIPVSVKCRVGLGFEPSYEELASFLHQVSAEGGIQDFTVHARGAVLGGRLSTADNRNIPPLQYATVTRAIAEFPQLNITVNGGLGHSDPVAEITSWLDAGASGVMIGRAACDDPWGVLGPVDHVIYGCPDEHLTRMHLVEDYVSMIPRWMQEYAPAASVVAQPLLHLFTRQEGSKAFRRALSQWMCGIKRTTAARRGHGASNHYTKKGKLVRWDDILDLVMRHVDPHVLHSTWADRQE